MTDVEAFKSAADEMRREARWHEERVQRAWNSESLAVARACRDRALEMAGVFDLWADEASREAPAVPVDVPLCTRCSMPLHLGSCVQRRSDD